MAKRYFTQFAAFATKGLSHLVAYVIFDTTNAPTLVKPSIAGGTGVVTYVTATGGYNGVSSITRNGTGDYTLALLDPYLEVISLHLTWFDSVANTITNYSIKASADPTTAASVGGNGWVDTTNKTIEILLMSSSATVADPATTAMAKIDLVVRDSAAV